MTDLIRSAPREVRTHTPSIPSTVAPAAIPSFIPTPDSQTPNNFWRRTLEARKRVMVTEEKRKQLAQRDCGELDMNCWSLRQSSRQMEKNGSRQPLNT